jgi:hypothetical protein
VAGYRLGELERRYHQLSLEEDCFVNYGFLARHHQALMHPRTSRRIWDAATQRQADELLAFVEQRGPTHPREVAAAFDHGRIPGHWGRLSNATKHLLDGLHYRGKLRVVRRENGIRIYETVARDPHDLDPAACAGELLKLVLATYAPLPWPSLVYLARLLEYGAPQLRPQIQSALGQAVATYPNAVINGLRWFWPEGDNPCSRRFAPDEDRVSFLAPFDPIVWDRRRFKLLWEWDYKFEAYTPAAQRRFGHYALPILRGGQVIGWGNLALRGQVLQADLGYVTGKPDDQAFRAGLKQEIDSMTSFLCGMDETG